MKVIKRVLNISFCFCILAGCLASCSQDEESVTNVSRTETEGINKDAILAFSSKDDIIQAVNSGESPTRAIALNPTTGLTVASPKILSLTDKVQANDPILNEVSEEEKQIILNECMTYYDMFGCEDYIPSPNFAKLLNSNREIQLNDSVYKITEFGTLRANQLNRKKLDLAYTKLKADTTIALKNADFIPVVKGVELHPFKQVLVNRDDAPLLTRSVATDIPSNNFKHYTTKSKTVLGKILGGIFGDRSVKHHEFMSKRRVNGSLYSYNYLVYYETGCFVSMSRKRGGFFKFINGWKDINADELFMQYKGIVMELNLDVPQGVLPSMPTNKKPEIASYSDMRIQGIDKVVHNTVDIFGYNVKEKDLYKFIGQGSKQIFSILKGWLGNPNELDKHYGANGQVPAVRILTPDKVYVIIADDTHNLPNVCKIRKVFNSGAKITLSYFWGASAWSTVLSSIKKTDKMPVKKLIGGEVLLAGKLSGKWGGMYISKN